MKKKTGSRKVKRCWHPLIDEYWTCSDINCERTAKFWRSDFNVPDGEKLLYEFACNRHVTRKREESLDEMR